MLCFPSIRNEIHISKSQKLELKWKICKMANGHTRLCSKIRTKIPKFVHYTLYIVLTGKEKIFKY